MIQETNQNRSVMRSRRAGSVLIIVLWVSLGLISIALYFGNSMSLELRAGDNRLAAIEAEQAIAGAARYIGHVLATNTTAIGTMPDPLNYTSEAVLVGDAYFWIIGRQTNDMVSVDIPAFGLVDESSKLNINTATVDMLQTLPRMTPELAAAIVDWRDTDQEVTQNGAESETYARRSPAYRAKDGKFESLEELRLVMGADLDLLYGEDSNLNGITDLNENDGENSPPLDNRDGRLDPGLLEYLTVYTRESMLGSNGSNKVNVASTNAPQLEAVLAQHLSADRAREIAGRFSGGPGGGGGGGGGGAQPMQSLLDFYLRSGMTEDEFAMVEPDLTISDQAREGLVNINTAPEAVLACLPGVGVEKASTLVAYRRGNTDKLKTIVWILDALDQASAVQAGPYITTHSYQFSADIAGAGHYGRGYKRVKFVFDTSDGTPRIVFRQDLTHLGWALGPSTRTMLLTQKETRL